MAELEFILRGESFPVAKLVALQVCDSLAHNLQGNQCFVRSNVASAVLRLFVSEVHGDAIELTTENIGGLSALCDEFQFRALSRRLETFKSTPTYRVEQRFQTLEAAVQSLRSDIGTLTSRVDSLQSKHQSSFADLRSTVNTLKEYIGPLSLIFPPFGSVIVSDFPDIFAEFRGKQFSLLWRGTRDGFGAGDFHRRCDGHANTLTVILDTDGNIFGGFTPVEWESRDWDVSVGWSNCWKDDPSVRSFIFTLKNPHNAPARRFGLKAEWKGEAIGCHRNWGPYFCDIAAADNCDANTDSPTEFFGVSYNNDTGLDGTTFFTGSENFKVKEIEVFEITA
jgi:hypothetical protein